MLSADGAVKFLQANGTRRRILARDASLVAEELSAWPGQRGVGAVLAGAFVALLAGGD